MKKCDIKVGDCVLVRQKRDKLTHRCHSCITAQNKNGHSITRNVSHFKPIQIDNTGDTDDDYKCPTVITNNNDSRNVEIDVDQVEAQEYQKDVDIQYHGIQVLKRGSDVIM